METVLQWGIKYKEELIAKLRPVLERNRGKFVYKKHTYEDIEIQSLSGPVESDDYELGIIAEEGDVILEERGFEINVNKLHAFRDRRRDPNKSRASKYNISIVTSGVDYYIGTAEELAKLPHFQELHSALEAELAESWRGQ